jgi:ABC-type transport system involved in cytochrome c biogenesis permease component
MMVDGYLEKISPCLLSLNVDLAAVLICHRLFIDEIEVGEER